MATRVTPRRRPQRHLSDPFTGSSVTATDLLDVHDPRRFDGLTPNWFWTDAFESPGRRCWAKEHANEVRRIRDQRGVSLKKLAALFGKSIPTIRHALKIAHDGP